jgi:hypothetical protein
MKLQTILSALLSFAILYIPSAHALVPQQNSAEKTFVIRITAREPANTIPFDATYMTISKQGASINKIDQVTPYEYSVNANFIGIMLEIADNNPDIKVDVYEKNNNHDDMRLTGTGHAIFAHAATNGNSYILAN